MSYSVLVVSTPLNDRTLSGVETGGRLMRQHIILILITTTFPVLGILFQSSLNIICLNISPRQARSKFYVEHVETVLYIDNIKFPELAEGNLSLKIMLLTLLLLKLYFFTKDLKSLNLMTLPFRGLTSLNSQARLGAFTEIIFLNRKK